jgi:NAD(P)-dependent dehydrogenase (short-subunit alcohol dehydrogenase family)
LAERVFDGGTGVAEATDDGRVVVVTGGASGIGHACVRRFAAAGDQVIVVDVNAIAGETVAAEIVEAGGNASFEPLDVTDRVAVVTLAARIDAAYGPAGVLINSAGILQKF